ncbi:MAG: hypothetical protein NXH72_07870 [Hyphomonadaceae bacterium]|nr:hypothetical protein [Hyphomonadaceae bacterium]
MTRPQNVVARKLANALMKDAEIGDRTQMILGPGGRLGTNAVKKLMGGLWVGGTAYLTDDAVEFHPNGMNRAIHKDPESLSVVLPLRSITSVETRFGIATQIIDIKTAIGTLSIRCYGAQGFARKIEAARAP